MLGDKLTVSGLCRFFNDSETVVRCICLWYKVRRAEFARFKADLREIQWSKKGSAFLFQIHTHTFKI